MSEPAQNRVFLSYSEDNLDLVEGIARRLLGDARLSFWFAPWHSIPGEPIQEQMEEALGEAQACAVFITSTGRLEGWQNEQMRAAIQARVEDAPGYRVIPVLGPDATPMTKRGLPRFLRLHEPVEFRNTDDERAFKRLLAGILGLRPIEVEGYLDVERSKLHLPAPPSGVFTNGHALVVGVAAYARVTPLPSTVLNDAQDLQALLTEPASCAYPPDQVTLLLDGQATGRSIRAALANLATKTGPKDTAIVFFSGHGAHIPDDIRSKEYILPWDCDLVDLDRTAISGVEMTELLGSISAGRLLVLFDACHSGGAGDPKASQTEFKRGLSQDYYATLAQGKGRVVMASSRPDELSWALNGMKNSLFTHFLLQALRGEGRTLGDGFVRVFDIFRHVAENVPARATQVAISQHPIFKATAMEEDFVVALTRRDR